MTQKFYKNSGDFPFEDTITNIHSNLSKKLRKTGFPEGGGSNQPPPPGGKGVKKGGGGVKSDISHPYKANAMNYVNGVY